MRGHAFYYVFCNEVNDMGIALHFDLKLPQIWFPKIFVFAGHFSSIESISSSDFAIQWPFLLDIFTYFINQRY